ncbi:malate dehydrogenase (oxaloacetate-decarboxylating) [Hypnocyclicus thermotrophus]|uniref:Malate dehydrogenase (Oxaloacetate-decarboxylating) n=1 Tax=Hypnocyclicus thermotrophus TaxID=1627895 RepID=A0AA46DZI2_9FUSO|nr:malic enzyme-like NAD(P)-binding protein [Hypnocyclicus thermotrophus]TDT71858.1 malate dehydrogenase (oxaloacetate-decarboxylating) [Hypnocyclicus thermotrophus]
MDIYKKALELHEKNKGKIEVISKINVKNKNDLTLAYSPGVAEPCREIVKNKENIYKYTSKGNLVAVVSDGSAVLGLGDIGPYAGLPVMEGKAILFKEFAGVNAVPLCLNTNDVDEIVKTVKLIAPNFGGINLEDISAPRCVEIERRLKEELDIPVFHDDQHGTAIVVTAALINAYRYLKKDITKATIVVNGIGAAGSAIIKMIKQLNPKNIIACDINGILNKNIHYENPLHNEIASITNNNLIKGSLATALKNADVFIGVSAPNIVTKDMIKSMNTDPVIFAMANPTPEIMPELAKKAGAKIIGTGRSDYPNQINNVLAFPGIFRGALDARAKTITEEMKIAAAYAIANVIPDEELADNYIIPDAFNKKVVENVANAIKKCVQ